MGDRRDRRHRNRIRTGPPFIPTAEIVAIGSRAIDTARSFAERFDVKRSYGSYDDLLADDNVQVVYIATPHAHHYATARAALEKGKHVLCEKPFTLDQAQADDIIAVAGRKACS